MHTDKKIKKMVDEQLAPDMSAEQFRKELGLVYTEQPKAEKKRNGLWFKICAPTVAAAVLCVAIILPITLNSDTVSEEPKYSSNDVVSILTDFDYITANDKIVLYDLEHELLNDGVYKNVLKNDSNHALSYSIQNSLYGFPGIEQSDYIFEFDYIIRLSKNFDFDSIDFYSNAEMKGETVGFSYSYNVVDKNGSTEVYISFEHGDYDYYVNLHGSDGLTELDDNSIQIFMGTAFASIES